MNNFGFESGFERNGTAPVSFQGRKNSFVSKNKIPTNGSSSPKQNKGIKSSKIVQTKERERPKTSVNMETDLSELNLSLRMNKLNAFSSETNLLDNEESNNKNRINLLLSQQFISNISNGSTKDRDTNDKEDFYTSNSWIETNSDVNSNNSANSNYNKEINTSIKKKEYSAYKQKIPELSGPKRPKSVKIINNTTSMGDKKSNVIINDINDNNKSKPLVRPTTTNSVISNTTNDKATIRTSTSRAENSNSIEKSFRHSVYGSIQNNPPRKEIVSTKSTITSLSTFSSPSTINTNKINAAKINETNNIISQPNPSSPKSKSFISKFTSKIKKERVSSPANEQLFSNNNNNNNNKESKASLVEKKSSSFLISELSRSPTSDFIEDLYDDDDIDNDIQKQIEKFISSPDLDDNKIIRPTSRKIYLGNDKIINETNFERDNPSTNLMYNQSVSSAFICVDQEGINKEHINLRPSNSFNGFSTSINWEQQEINRPPSRQNSTFPLYCADPNHEADDFDNFEIYDDDDDDDNIEYDDMQFNMDNKDEEKSNRPTTQKKAGAQHLFDDSIDKNKVNDNFKSTNQIINKISNLNMNNNNNNNNNNGYNQKELVLIKKQLSNTLSTSPNNLKKIDRSISSSSLLSLETTQSNRIDRGDRAINTRRQYDPISDGFTDLGDASNILPFRIEINYSSANLSSRSNSIDRSDVDEEVEVEYEIEEKNISHIKNPTTSVPSGQLFHSQSHANIMPPSSRASSAYRSNRNNSTSLRNLTSSHNPSPLLNAHIYNEENLKLVVEKPPLRRSFSENFSNTSIVVDTDLKDFSPLSSPVHSNKTKFRSTLFNSIHSNDKTQPISMFNIVHDSPVQDSKSVYEDDEIDEDLLDIVSEASHNSDLCQSGASFVLESSLGEDFLSLFAPG